MNRKINKAKRQKPLPTEENVAQAAAEIVSNGLERFTEGLERFNKLREKVRNRIEQGGRRNISTTE